MTEPTDPPTPARRAALTWNAGGWFGALFGCSCWMAAAGLAVLDVAPRAALAALGCWGFAVAAGLLLWRARRRLTPLVGMQGLLLATGLASAGALAALTLLGGEEAARRIDRLSQVPLSTGWWWLLAYPAVMLLLALLASRRRG